MASFLLLLSVAARTAALTILAAAGITPGVASRVCPQGTCRGAPGAQVAQLVEHAPEKCGVDGSTPPLGTIFFPLRERPPPGRRGSPGGAVRRPPDPRVRRGASLSQTAPRIRSGRASLAILKVMKLGAEVLRRPATEIEPKDLKRGRFRGLFDDLRETMVEYSGTGLAAPQVAAPVRAVLYMVEPVGRRGDGPRGPAHDSRQPLVRGARPEGGRGLGGVPLRAVPLGPGSAGRERSGSARSRRRGSRSTSSRRTSTPGSSSTRATTSTA